MKKRLLSLAFALPLLSSLSNSADAQALRDYDDEQLAPLATGLADYFEAREKSLGAEEARAAVVGALATLAEGQAPVDPLSSAPDLGRALWLSHDFDARKPRTGKLVTEGLERGSFEGEGLEISYRLPKEYDAGERAYPLILAIPDFGESPAEHIRAHWIDRAVRDGAILLSPAMPIEREEWDRVMVNGRPGGLAHVLSALRFATESFAVDPDRVYVAGRGKGVPAAVAAGNYSPQRFAGVIGRAGDTAQQGPENFGNLPSWFSGAGANARAFKEAVEEAGFDNCRLAVGGKEAELWSWIEEHPRDPYPARVELVVGQPFPTRAYWLRVSPIASDAHVSARIERDSNTIHIDGEGVSHATLYLNDELVDLDAELTVICRGVKHTLRAPRRLAIALDLIQDGTSDPGAIYVAEQSFDLRAEEASEVAALVDAMDTEFAERLEAAGEEIAALWSLHEWCIATQRAGSDAISLRRIVRLAPDHEEARAALGHVRGGERWFRSRAALKGFERSQDPELAAAKGHVENRGFWMHKDERARVGKGFTKDPESGRWLSVSDRKRVAEGWVLQDQNWIAPEDAHLVDQGQWLVAGEWVGLEEAQRRHARIDSMWRIPGAEILLYTTVEREVARRAMHQMSRALTDLRRVFGAEPVLPLSALVLKDEEQYDRFAFGDPDGRRLPAHVGRLHTLHSAFFAESWFPPVEGKESYNGMGVCYWNAAVPYGDLYGVHSARLAVGLSYVDALDPSPKAVRKASSKGLTPGYYDAFNAEKDLPGWLRYGGAVYAERYFRDDTVAEDGDVWWARNWSLDNLRQRGGLRPLTELFAFELDPEEAEDGLKLLIEAGLVVAFMVDGECAPVMEAHADLKRALVKGRVHANQIDALTEALIEKEAQLREFGGL